MRYENYGPTDAQPMVDGDAAFVGVDERPDPGVVPAGYVSSATNARFRDGVISTRPGIALVPWLKSATTPFTSVQGAGTFLDPDGDAYILIAAEGKVYAMRPGVPAVEVPLPAGVTLSGQIRFTQAFNKIILARGYSLAPLVMDNLVDGFDTVTQENSESGNGTGTLPIPGHNHAEFFQDRLVIAGDNDLGYVSDIGNHTRFAQYAAYRINTGNTDTLQRFKRFNETSVVAFKDGSVYLISNLIPDENGDWSAAQQSTITEAHGLASLDAVVDTGQDLFYLSEKGVTSLRLTEEGRVRAVDLPLSDPLRKTWSRINTNHLDKAQMAYWDNKLYVALPLDDAVLLGDNLVGEGLTYTGGFPFIDRITGQLANNITVTGLEVGEKYRFITNSEVDRLLINGTDFFDEWVQGPAEFIATATSVMIYGTNNQPVTCEVRKVTEEGVCNAVAVYDFLNSAWAGLDESAGVTLVKRFVTFPWEGRDQLGFIGHDGYFRIYEWGWEDMKPETVSQPYIDLLVVLPPANGNTLQVNSGDTVTANFVGNSNVGTSWGCVSQFAAVNNLWLGYDPDGDFQWDPGTGVTASEIAQGVRFTHATTLPTITTTGAWAATVSHSGVEFACVPITLAVTLRGYQAGSVVRKRFSEVALGLAWWAGTLTLSVQVEGHAESAPVRNDYTPSRTAHIRGNLAAWDPANEAEDHGNPYREDYSVVLPATGMELGSGIYLDTHQEVTLQAPLDIKGRYLQPVVTMVGGHLEITHARVGGTPHGRAHGIKA